MYIYNNFFNMISTTFIFVFFSALALVLWIVIWVFSLYNPNQEKDRGWIKIVKKIIFYLILFLVGYSLRWAISDYYGVNVFTQYKEVVSIGFYLILPPLNYMIKFFVDNFLFFKGESNQIIFKDKISLKSLVREVQYLNTLNLKELFSQKMYINAPIEPNLENKDITKKSPTMLLSSSMNSKDLVNRVNTETRVNNTPQFNVPTESRPQIILPELKVNRPSTPPVIEVPRKFVILVPNHINSEYNLPWMTDYSTTLPFEPEMPLTLLLGGDPKKWSLLDVLGKDWNNVHRFNEDTLNEVYVECLKKVDYYILEYLAVLFDMQEDIRVGLSNRELVILRDERNIAEISKKLSESIQEVKHLEDMGVRNNSIVCWGKRDSAELTRIQVELELKRSRGYCTKIYRWYLTNR